MRNVAFVVLASVGVGLSPASAVDFRWTSGFAMGTSMATIENGDGASLQIYCPSGQTDTTPGMFIHPKRLNPSKGEQLTVQIVVDGKAHSFYFEETHFKAGGRSAQQDLISLVRALSRSKQRYFVVEFPKYRVSERFSLLDATRVLASEGDILEGCI